MPSRDSMRDQSTSVNQGAGIGAAPGLPGNPAMAARRRDSRMLWISFAYAAAIGASLALLWRGLSIELPADADASAANQVIGQRNMYLASGFITLVVAICTYPLAQLLNSLLRTQERAQRMSEHVELIAQTVRAMTEFGGMSDDARRVINRKREGTLLRAAIEEDIQAEEWDAAMVLIKELAERFGNRADAEELRQRVESARAETMERKVKDAIALLDGLIIQRRWDAALADAARIRRLYPDSPRVEGLKHRVEAARDAYVAELERRFLVAAQEERVDDAMEMLKELDLYITEQEAAPFREVARGVIGKARDNLGAQFKMAVQDRRWHDAARVGDRIIQEFPNSRMAAEVRSLIDGIRAHASEASAIA